MFIKIISWSLKKNHKKCRQIEKIKQVYDIYIGFGSMVMY